MSQLDINQAELARRAEMDPSEITKLFNGKRGWTLRTMQRIAAALDMPVSDLLASGAAQPAETNVRGRVDDLRERTAAPLPIYRWGTAGDPRSDQAGPNPHREDYPPLRQELLIGPRGFGVDVRGDSMAAKDILDGDTVWINPDKPVRLGQVVLARCWDADGTELGMVVKLWVSTPFGQALQSAYARDEQRAVIECERFEVIGPVVLVQRVFPPG